MLRVGRESGRLVRRLTRPGASREASTETTTTLASNSGDNTGRNFDVDQRGKYLASTASVLSRDGGQKTGNEWKWAGFAGVGMGIGLGMGLGVLDGCVDADSRKNGNAGADRLALADAKSHLNKVWNRIEHDLVESGVELPDSGEPKILLVDDRLSIRFRVRREADLSAVIVELVHGLTGRGCENAVKDGAMKLKVAECGVARVLQFEKLREVGDDGDQGTSRKEFVEEKDLFAQVFVPTFHDDLPEVEFLKPGALSKEDLDAISNTLKVSNSIRNNYSGWSTIHQIERLDNWMESQLRKPVEEMMDFMLKDFHSFLHRDDLDVHRRRKEWQSEPNEDAGTDAVWDQEKMARKIESPHSTSGSKSENQLVAQLEKMGAKVYLPFPKNKVDWGMLAGYEDQKRRIEDGLLLPLLHPEVFDGVARQTRKHFVTNRPRGVLFEGPPGTGKTTSARVIASQAAVPLVYIPLEAVMSKWYGEAEKLLAQVFKNADQLGGSIIFLDEIETLATTRSSDMHEATRRLLGVLLREMDGFDTSKKTVVIGATNRKQDVDPALLSRFDAAIKFDLPELSCRELIIEQYAKHLNKEEIAKLAAQTEGMSGRDLRDICEQSERSWASKIVREEVKGGEPPCIEEYLKAVEYRQKDLDETS